MSWLYDVASNIDTFLANAKQRWWDCFAWSTAHDPKHLDLCCLVHQLMSSIHRDAAALGFGLAVVSSCNGRDRATYDMYFTGR